MLFGIRGLEESSVYQEGHRKGEVQGARESLIFLGTRKLGPPDESTRAKIAVLSDVDRLHELSARIFDVASWDELLASPN